MFIIKAHGVFKKNELNDLIPALRGQGSKEMNPEWNTQQRIDKRSGALGGPRLRKPDQKSLCGKLQDKGRETQRGECQRLPSLAIVLWIVPVPPRFDIIRHSRAVVFKYFCTYIP